MVRIYPLLTLSLVTVGVAAASAACGGSSPPPTTATAPTSTVAEVATNETSSAPGSSVASATPSAAPTPSAEPSGRGGAVGLGGIDCAPATGGAHAAGPTLTLATPTVSGKLPADAVERVVRQDMGKFRVCYEDLLKTKSTAHGNVAFELSIAATGAVTAAKDSASDIGDPKMVACVRQTMLKIKFPKPEAGTAKATVSIAFDASK